MTLGDLRAMCVAAFPLSTTRPPIMDGVEQVVNRLIGAGVKGHLWVDGSFLTEKIDPNDVDCVLPFDAAIQRGTPEGDAIEWLAVSPQRAQFYCDAYCFPVYPNGHPLYAHGVMAATYWVRQFGWSRGQDVKGIATVRLG
jgi:hypothetical protein